MKFPAKILVCLLTIFSLQQPKAQEKLSLKFNLEPKNRILLSIDLHQSVTQTVDGEEQTMANEMLTVWSFDVIDKNTSGDMNITLTYERIKISQDYGRQITEYDSDNHPAFLDPPMKGLATLPNAQLTIRFTPDGHVSDIQGIEPLLDKMIAAMEIPETPEKQGVLNDLRKQFGLEALRQSLEDLTSFYPDKPVSVGEIWVSDLNQTSGFPMRVISDYTLKSRDKGIAVIDVSSKIESDTASNTMTLGLLTMAYEISGGQAGTIRVDENTGLPVNSELERHFAGTVSISGIPDQEPRTLPISATGSIIVTTQKQ